MGLGRGVITFVLSFLMAISLVLLLFSYGSIVLLSPNIYLIGLEETGVYEYIDERIQNVSGGGFIDDSEGDFKEIVETGVVEIFRYINSETDELEIKIKIDQSELQDFFVSQVEQIRICDVGEDIYGEDGRILCRYSQIEASEFLNDYLEENNLSIMEQDEVDLIELYGLIEGSEGREVLNNTRNGVIYYLIALYLLSAISVASIIVIMVVHIKEIEKGINWVGIDILIAGIISLILSYFSQGIFNLILSKISEVTIGLVLDIEILVIVIYSVLLERFLTFSLILVGVGIVLVIFSYLYSKIAKNRLHKTI